MQLYIFIRHICFVSFCGDQSQTTDYIIHVGGKGLCFDNIYLAMIYPLLIIFPCPIFIDI